MLDPATGRFDAEATPSTGTDLLFDYYHRLLAGEETAELDWSDNGGCDMGDCLSTGRADWRAMPTAWNALS